MKWTAGLVGLAMMLVALPAWAANPVDLSGTWRVNLRADYSTCKEIRRGDVVQVEWVFSFGKPGEVNVVTVGSDNLDDRFTGHIQGDRLGLQTRRLDHLSTLEVTITGASLQGRRVDANATPCAVIYEITGNRKEAGR